MADIRDVGSVRPLWQIRPMAEGDVKRRPRGRTPRKQEAREDRQKTGDEPGHIDEYA